MTDLTNKTAVVTGAAAGIGQALAREFASQKMKVVLADRDADALHEEAGRLRAQGAAAIGVPTDVTRAEEVKELADFSYQEFGAVDVLCNNAGVLGRILTSWQQPLENWNWVFDVNVKGVIHGLHFFLPRMLAQHTEGFILNTGSIAGMITGPYFAPYNASKHAVVALSECLHHELAMLGSKVKVGVLCPGWVNTGLATIETKLPAELRSVNAAISQEQQAAARERDVRAMVSASIAPERIAEIVVEAIRQQRFYVFPHPERKQDVRRRLEDILEERAPAFGPMAQD